MAVRHNYSTSDIAGVDGEPATITMRGDGPTRTVQIAHTTTGDAGPAVLLDDLREVLDTMCEGIAFGYASTNR